MKSLHSQSCSCTSCVYKSEIDRPSVGKLVALGSRIDKLYLGKYIPLRERTLLRKLVRTRDAYDDIRAQLLSDSNQSDSDSKPRKNMQIVQRGKDDDAKSSAVLELVNLVDQGSTFKNLSECCSCCSCGSTIPLQENEGRIHRHGRAHISSRSSMISGQRTKNEGRIGKQTRRKIQRIVSDPNFRTSNYGEIIKRQSKAFVKKLRSKKQEETFVSYDEPYNQETSEEYQRNKLKGYKIKQAMGETMRKSLTKLKQSKTKIKDKVDTALRKPIQETFESPDRPYYQESSEEYQRNKFKGYKIKQAMGETMRKSLTKLRQSKTQIKGKVDIALRKNIQEAFESPDEPYYQESSEEYQRNKLKGYKIKQAMGENMRKSLTKLRPSKTKIKDKVDIALRKNIHERFESPDEPYYQESSEEYQRNKLKGYKIKQAMGENMRKSLTKLRQSKTKIKDKVDIALRKTIHKLRPDSQQEEFSDDENIFDIRKDSLTKYREDTYKKMKDWQCDLGCKPGECIPEDCFKIITKKRQRNRVTMKAVRKTETHKKTAVTSSSSKVGISAKNEHNVVATGTKNQKITTRHLDKKESHIETRAGKEVSKTIAKPDETTTKQNEKKSVKSNTSLLSKKSKPLLQSTSKKELSKLPSHAQKVNQKRREAKQSPKIQHKSSNTIQNKGKNTQSGSLALRRCFCTLKIRPNKNKAKMTKTLRDQQTSIVNKSITKNLQTTKLPQMSELLPYECEPNVCVPGRCDPIECEKIIRNRGKPAMINTKPAMVNTKRSNYKSRSSPSITSKSVSSGGSKRLKPYKQDKRTVSQQQGQIQSNVTDKAKRPRQAVRISSNFSFSIEFNKKGGRYNLDDNVKTADFQSAFNEENNRKRNKSVGKGISYRMAHKTSQMSTFGKTKNASTNNDLRKCFCTLKIAKQGTKRQIQFSRGTLTTGQSLPTTVKPKVMHRATEKREGQRNFKYNILPYECEPGICVPGECNPYKCLELINKRNQVKTYAQLSGTDKLETKSTYSITRKRIMHEKAANVKPVSNIQINEKVIQKRVPREIKSSSDKQAVRIESTFNFNIEFYRDKKIPFSNETPVNKIQQVPTKYVAHKTGANTASRERQSQGNFVRRRQKSSLAQTRNSEKGVLVQSAMKRCFCTLKLHKMAKNKAKEASQTSEIKNDDKSSGIRPILKRCFCTLKLQKKQNTVMPVLIKDQHFSSHYKDLSRLEHVLPYHSDSYGIYSSSFASSFTSSCANSLNLNTPDYFRRYRQISSISTIHKINSLIVTKSNSVIGANRHLNNCFYAMNMQVQNTQKRRYKLDPNECEPGICIPGECNPIECQKLIMKRLMRRASTMTSAEKQTRSISSGILQTKSKRQQYNRASFKEGKVQPRRIEKRQPEFKLQTLPKSHKQAVRVGSSFSFNIEFSKDKTNAQPAFQDYARKKRQGSSSVNTDFKRTRSRSTLDSQGRRRHRTSQSLIAMHHKGSHARPKMKRCFCTLKLQKKGRQSQAADIKLINRKEEESKNEEKKPVVTTTTVGQNTKRYKPYSLSDLDPYECEPNVCIPGECDPYECLERIKRRGNRRNTKDLGTGMDRNRSSASSMTSSQRRFEKGKQTHFKEKPIIRKVRAPTDNIIVTKAVKPSRQAVRIGSSFSFNVEFFKDVPNSNDIINSPRTNIPTHPTDHRSQRIGRDRNLQQKYVQDFNPIRHQDSQSETPGQREKYTKTDSFLKRCFCTAKLHRRKLASNTNLKPQIQYEAASTTANIRPEPHGPSFLKRCFCTLKLLSASKPQHLNANTKPQPRVRESNAFAQTRKYREREERNKIILKLDPFECEPGVCIPGECDPHVCELRIKRRNANMDKMSSTMAQGGSKSTSTLFRTPNTSSAGSYANMQHKTKRSKPNEQNLTEYRLTSPSTIQSNTKQRSAVRIGSNFSFNVEFYKEKTPTADSIQIAAAAIKKPKRRVVSTDMNRPHTEARGVDNDVLSHSRESQVDRIKVVDTATGVSHMLKRCFCTLGLHKPPVRSKDAVNKAKKVGIVLKRTEYETRGTKTPTRFKNTERFNSNKLEPYECEPGICIPGQCDPYECLKRIKRRQLKESGTETLKLSSKSATTMKRVAQRKQKHQNMQSVTRSKSSTAIKNYAPVAQPVKIYKDSGKDGGRQAVRIGSTFSFNIEFSKSNNSGGGNELPKLRNDTKSMISQSQASRTSGRSRHKRTQRNKSFRHVDSQVLAKKVRSTVTEARPFLKRCFCTLKLQKEGRMNQTKIVNPQPVKQMRDSSVSAKFKDKTAKRDWRRFLEPYECEPNICIPGECDPLECYERIKLRNARTNTGTYWGPSMKSVSISTGNKKGQFKKIQTNKTKSVVVRPSYSQIRQRAEHTSHTVFGENRNRQSVRLGSNFSFQIEFNKDTTLPKAMKEIKFERPSTIDSNSQYGSRSVKCTDRASCFDSQSARHRAQQAQVAQASKSSGIVPRLKRCFCTLALQNNEANKNTRDRQRNVKVFYTFDPYVPNEPVAHTLKTENKASKRDFGTPEFYLQPNKQNVLTVGRVEEKITKSPFQPTPYNVYNVYQNKGRTCKCVKPNHGPGVKTVSTKINNKYLYNRAEQKDDYIKIQNNDGDMQTLLPYKRRKFKSRESTTLVSPQKDKINCPCDTLRSGKKLTAKRERQVLQQTNTSAVKKFVCSCMRAFSRRRGEDFEAKGVSGNVQREQVIRQKQPSFSRQARDAEGSFNNNQISIKSNDKIRTSKSEKCPFYKYPLTKKSKSLRAVGIRFTKKGRGIDGRFNPFSTLQAGDTVQTQSRNKTFTPVYNQSTKEDIPENRGHTKSCSCCKCAAKRLARANKAAKNTKNLELSNLCPACKSQSANAKATSNATPGNNVDPSKVCPCCQRDISKPSGNGKINDKDKSLPEGTLDQKDKSKPLTKGKLDQKGKEKPLTTGNLNQKGKGKSLTTGNLNQKGKAKTLPKGTLNKGPDKGNRNNTCTCTNICECYIKKKHKKKKHKRKKKLSFDLNKKLTEKYAEMKRLHAWKNEDNERRKARHKIDKKLMKEVEKFKDDGDLSLIVGSLFDIAKLGFTTLTDILRSTYRTIFDPRRTLRGIKQALTNPKYAYHDFKMILRDSGVNGTFNRVKMRLACLKSVKFGRRKMEESPALNYILYINDKNPQKKHTPRKKKKTREPLEYDCSLYMGSLRKRPCLYIWYTCPWFYPHCLSLLNVWKQFTDIVLFLLAVLVWSPCIFGMEACRGLMCCMLCTG